MEPHHPAQRLRHLDDGQATHPLLTLVGQEPLVTVLQQEANGVRLLQEGAQQRGVGSRRGLRRVAGQRWLLDGLEQSEELCRGWCFLAP